MVVPGRARRGIPPVLVALGVVALACVAGDAWRAERLLLAVVWAAGTALRWYWGDGQVGMDAIVFGMASVWAARKEVVVVARGICGEMWSLMSRFVIPVAMGALLLWRWLEERKAVGKMGVLEGLSKWNVQHPGPRIFPCVTKHARMFPKRHAFEYTYLQAGFPIIPAGVTPEGDDVGGLHDRQLGSWWLRINAADYLNRGCGQLGFYGKLKMYLREQHVDDSEWSYAYLVTAPRFFGYAFNPVSFWYVYDSDQQLKKMILEVNNTFGERRMYLLDGSSMPSPPSTPESEIAGPELPTGAKSRFADLWMKDFHVSPFNSRKGSYALKALNPFLYASYDNPQIDNTITLKSSKDHAKLVARLNSNGKALDPAHFSIFGALRFVLGWWWVGLVTFPRIIREAFKIFFKRKLHVWFRPEVLSSSVGRAPTSTEIELYHVFKDYLSYLVEQSRDNFRITLYSAIPDEPVQHINSSHHDSAPRELEFHVSTPAFYSRFVHYSYTSEAFDRECVFTDEKNRTLWISRPELLATLLSGSRTPDVKNGPVQKSYLDQLRWTAMKRLRCPPATPAYPVSTPSKAEFTLEDVRSLPLSELDCFVRHARSCTYAGEYRRLVTKLFLAQRLSLGFAEVIGALDVIIRVILCSLGAFYIFDWSSQDSAWDVARCSWDTTGNRDGNACVDNRAGSTWLWLLGTATAVSACNIYELIKGYD